MLESARVVLERKATTGIEVCLNAAMNYLRHMLTQQRKLDFSDRSSGCIATPTAVQVTDYFVKLVELVKETTTGQNHYTISAELGLRFHRDLMDHLDGFHFNTEEGMTLICDVKQYRDAAVLLNVEMTTKLFNEMVLLANLLVVKSSDLLGLCQEILKNVQSLESVGYFLRLRDDFKSVADSVDDYTWIGGEETRTLKTNKQQPVFLWKYWTWKASENTMPIMNPNNDTFPRVALLC